MNTDVSLAAYFQSLGMPESAWHIGPEHPGIEELALRVLASTARARVLEIGVQSGGFAVPVILGSVHRRGFCYLGVDNLEYTNAVPLRLIADYLRLRGAGDAVTFIEGDSSAVLRSVARESYDLIMLDHYKPKYPLDLYRICARGLLSADGVIVLHDVLAHAAAEWSVCERVCRAFGYEWTIDVNVPQGAAVVRRGSRSGSKVECRMVHAEAVARWMVHASVLRSRRAVGRLLRSAGWR